MSHSKDLTKKFKHFKAKILAESVFDSADSIYGLSKEHIEVILGIPMPLLMESVDKTTRKRILREQFLYEQFMEAAQVAPGAKGFLGGVQHTAIELANRVKNIPSNLASFKDFMSVVFSTPQYLQVFSLIVIQKVKEMKKTFDKTIIPFKKKLTEITEKTEDYNLLRIAQETLKGVQAFESLVEKSYEAKGWVQAAFGVALIGIFGFLASKYEVIAHFLGTAAKGAYIGSDVDAAGAGGGAVTTVSADLLIKGLKKIAVFFAGNVIDAIKAAATSGFWTAIEMIAKLVGGVNVLLRLLAPIFEKVVAIYNINQSDPRTQLAPSKQLGEAIKLSDLLF